MYNERQKLKNNKMKKKLVDDFTQPLFFVYQLLNNIYVYDLVYILFLKEIH